MGYLYKGDAILKGNLSIATNKPLDARSVVQNATELLTIDSANAYTGMPIVSIDEAVVYILLDENNISSLASWKKIGNVIIDGNEIDLNSFVTTSELETQLNTVKTEISNNVDTKISTSKTNGSISKTVTATYPWFINNSEQALVAIGSSKTIEVSLTGSPSIKVQFANSTVTIQADLGFGWMDVDWNVNIDNTNLGGAVDETVPYKVYSKSDSYSNSVKHKITINLSK